MVDLGYDPGVFWLTWVVVDLGGLAVVLGSPQFAVGWVLQ